MRKTSLRKIRRLRKKHRKDVIMTRMILYGFRRFEEQVKDAFSSDAILNTGRPSWLSKMSRDTYVGVPITLPIKKQETKTGDE